MSDAERNKRREDIHFHDKNGSRSPFSSNNLASLGADLHNNNPGPDRPKKNRKANPGILDWIVDPLRGLFSPLKPLLISVLREITSKKEFDAHIDEVKATPAAAKQALIDLIKPKSPITPEEAYLKAWDILDKGDRLIYSVMGDTFMMELLGAGLVDIHASLLQKAPSTAAALNVATRAAEEMALGSITLALRRYLLKQTTPALPPYQDMISIYVREGYMAEKWVEIPPEFAEFMKELGYSEAWTNRLWGQHWVLPGVTLLYEMFHKKIIDYKTMVQMLKYHDFEPVWRDRLIANAWALIPRVDLRRGYAWGIISGDQLQERYEKLGFSPEDARSMTGIAKRYGLTAYYSRLLTVAAATFRKGQLPGPAFQNIMELCGLPGEAQDLLLSAESMARDAAVTEPGEEPRTLSASQILTLYGKGLLSRDAAGDRLEAMGYLEGDVNLLLDLATPKPAAEQPATEIVSAASLLYRNGWMSPEEFEGWLRKANLTAEEIQVTRDAQDLRYWLDYASDLLALWKQMYAKDLITLDEFYTNLLKWGCQPDRASAIVSLEETRKIPKPRAAG